MTDNIDLNSTGSYLLFTEPVAASFRIHGQGGKTLLVLHPDGKVEMEAEDADEAARIFCDSVRGYLDKAGWTNPDRLKDSIAILNKQTEDLSREIDVLQKQVAVSITSSESENRMITAMCLWENFLDLRNLYRHRNCELDQFPMDIYRALVRGLVNDCLEAWKKVVALGEAAIEKESPYDVRFCRRFLEKNIHRLTNEDPDHV